MVARGFCLLVPRATVPALKILFRLARNRAAFQQQPERPSGFPIQLPRVSPAKMPDPLTA